MSTYDALGRRRAPGQQRGLRPLHPPLPRGLRSRSIRVAMSERAWGLLEVVVARAGDRTPPRTVGRILEEALEAAARTRPVAAPDDASAGTVTDWLQWQIDKEQALLRRDAVAS